MKIKVEFTVDVPRHRLSDLRECALADTNAEAADYVRAQAREEIRMYLEGNVGDDITITEPWEHRT